MRSPWPSPPAHRAAAVPVALALVATLAAPAHAGPPKVTYTVDEEDGGWQPLDPGDLAKTLEHVVLEVLSKPGLVQLEKRSKRAKPEEQGDYVLEILGRTVAEAETHSVYLTFGPGQKSDVPSFRASDSVVLSKLPRGKMLSAVEASAKKAAAELLAVLGPQLAAAGRASSTAEPPKDPLSEAKTVPWRWPDVRVPQPSAGRAADGLYSKNHDERMASLRELTSLALTEASPRNVLERCVLTHSVDDMRVGCLKALRPLSRKIAPTQRVVIEAFRKDRDGDVRNEASEQMRYFTGGARADAIQAWLESLGKCQDPGPLDEVGDLPNLDHALASCLLACGKKPKYQRSKRSCIEHLEPLPLERRRRILWRHLQETDSESPYYVEGAGEQEGSTGTDWQWAAEALLAGARRWDPAMEELLWSRYQRTLSASSLDMLADQAEPSERLAKRLLEVVETSGGFDPLRGLERVGEAKPELAPMIVEKLSELLATSAYPKTVRPSDLERVIKALTPKEKKR